MTRLNKVLEVMAKEQVDCVIIKDETTIRYVTGFSGDSSLFYLDRFKGIGIRGNVFPVEISVDQLAEKPRCMLGMLGQLQDRAVAGRDG